MGHELNRNLIQRTALFPAVSGIVHNSFKELTEINLLVINESDLLDFVRHYSTLLYNVHIGINLDINRILVCLFIYWSFWRERTIARQWNCGIR